MQAGNDSEIPNPQIEIESRGGVLQRFNHGKSLASLLASLFHSRSLSRTERSHRDDSLTDKAEEPYLGNVESANLPFYPRIRINKIMLEAKLSRPSTLSKLPHHR
jgi:hypothetical protein